MPEHLRSLVVILFLSSCVFIFLRVSATEIIGAKAFALRRNLWFGITLFAFLAHNYWIFIFASTFLLFFALPREQNKVALFVFLLFTVPTGGFEIPGFGIINYFFILNHPRFLALCILGPLFLKLWGHEIRSGSRNNTLDKLVIAFIILCMVLQFRGTSFTDALRGAFYLFLDIYLPYFVVSRSLNNLDDFKDTLFSFVAVVMVLAAIGVFELLKYWKLYTGVTDVLGLQENTFYLQRAGYLRAQASLEIIALGFVCAVGLGFHLFFYNFYSSKIRYFIVFGSILAGLISPLSRGPWVGAAIIFMVYFLISTNKMRKLPLILAGLGAFIVVASFTPLGRTLVGLIPFVGDIESGNISYRQQLITNSWIVLWRNPLLGSIDYLLEPEMEALRTGQGIIDVVNTYISVMLKYGLVGLSLFGGIFAVACLKVYTSFSRAVQLGTQEKNLGKVLLASLLGIIVTIGTVSSISAIPITYWVVLGMCSAYSRMIHIRKLKILRDHITANTLDNKKLNPLYSASQTRLPYPSRK